MDELLIIKSSENTNFNDVRLFMFFSMFQPYEEDDVIGFYLTLSLDVLFEVLRFGDRHRLTKLERVGSIIWSKNGLARCLFYVWILDLSH